MGSASALVRSGIESAGERGWQAIFVLGAPEYYGRFGFGAMAARGFSSPYSGEHFMMSQLGWPAPVERGVVQYPPAFDRLGYASLDADGGTHRLADRAVEHEVGDPVDIGLLAIDNHEPRAVVLREGGKACRRVNHERRAED